MLLAPEQEGVGGYFLFVGVTHTQGQGSGRGSHSTCLSTPTFDPPTSPSKVLRWCSAKGCLPGPAQGPPVFLPVTASGATQALVFFPGSSLSALPPFLADMEILRRSIPQGRGLALQAG